MLADAPRAVAALAYLTYVSLSTTCVTSAAGWTPSKAAARGKLFFPQALPGARICVKECLHHTSQGECLPACSWQFSKVFEYRGPLTSFARTPPGL
jgi:hypothetical protein